MSDWENYQILEKLLNILDIDSIPSEHHLGRPFMTPYQLAIAFKQHYPETFNLLGLPVGGKGTNQHTSLAQYLARELSRHIKNHTISDQIEGGFLCNGYISDLIFIDGDDEIISSSEQSYHVSIFRRID